MRWMARFTSSPDGLLHSNGEVCCILGVCCPPAAARAKMVSEFQKVSGYDADGCDKIVAFLEERFDFAPKGMIQPLIDHIATMARKHPAGV